MVKNLCFYSRGEGSIPGQGTKIPHASGHGQKKKKKRSDWEAVFPRSGSILLSLGIISS